MLYLTNQSQASWLFSIHQPQKAFENMSVHCHAAMYLEKAMFLLVLKLPESPEFSTFPIGQVENSSDSGKLDVTSRNTIYPLQSSAIMKGINSGATDRKMGQGFEGGVVKMFIFPLHMF